MSDSLVTLFHFIISLGLSYGLLKLLKLIQPHINILGIQPVSLSITNILLGAIFFAIIFKRPKSYV